MKKESRKRKLRPDRAIEHEEWKEGRRPRIDGKKIVALYGHLCVKDGKNWHIMFGETMIKNKTKKAAIRDWLTVQGMAIDG